jgi:hypothetical protein
MSENAKKKKIEDSNESEINKKLTSSEETNKGLTSNVPAHPPIPKPEKGSGLEKFKSKRAPTIANVATLQTALPHYKISEAGDFVRLHPDEENFWSDEFCFVNVPIKGQKPNFFI